MHELKIGKEVLAEHVSGQRWRMARGCCAPFAPVLMLLMLLLACPRDSPLHRNVPPFSPRRPHRVALTRVTLTVPHPSFNFAVPACHRTLARLVHDLAWICLADDTLSITLPFISPHH